MVGCNTVIHPRDSVDRRDGMSPWRPIKEQIVMANLTERMVLSK